MKKIILAVALLAGMTFVACSNDDDKKTIASCVTCEAYTSAGISVPEFEICEADFDNREQYEQFVDLTESSTNCN